MKLSRYEKIKTACRDRIFSPLSNIKAARKENPLTTHKKQITKKIQKFQCLS